MSIPATALSRVRVADVMHTGVLTTDPDTPLSVVARLMADQRVHAVVVADPAYVRRPWGVVTTLEVARALANDSDETAGQAARQPVATIRADQPLGTAARLMADRQLTHLLVIDPGTGHASGILSSLDVAAAYAE